ncbi:hypothetical protein Scep_017640 [Stephania cephalantha]|uniref:Uncharacterized protein n=1 Tax=Stephania cephalantha TaxID=152367 RepID=A0AAP0IPY4_9MAGN
MGRLSLPLACQAALKDDYTMIFYPPTSTAIGGRLSPSGLSYFTYKGPLLVIKDSSDRGKGKDTLGNVH